MFDISDLDKVMFGSKPAGEGEGGGVGGGREEGGRGWAKHAEIWPSWDKLQYSYLVQQ